MELPRPRLERAVAGWLAHHAQDLQRVGLGIVFLWLGALKFVPGLSPAEALIAATVGWAVDPQLFLPVLAAWECLLGIGLIAHRAPRATLLMMFAHMGGTFMPLVACPELVWTSAPFGFTLEGQYILKNLVLVGAGLTLFGRLASPADARRYAPPQSGSRCLDRLRARRAQAVRLDRRGLLDGLRHPRLSG